MKKRLEWENGLSEVKGLIWNTPAQGVGTCLPARPREVGLDSKAGAQVNHPLHGNNELRPGGSVRGRALWQARGGHHAREGGQNPTIPIFLASDFRPLIPLVSPPLQPPISHYIAHCATS